MNAEMTQFCENIRKLNRDELMKLCVTLKQENIDLLIRAAENARATTAAAIDFQKYKAENEKLKAENSDLTKALAHEIEKNKLRNRDQFGSKAEPLKGILTEKDEREDINDIENVEDADLSKTKHVTTRSGRNGRTDYHKTPGKRAEEYAGLPVVNSFDLQIDELNRMYGEGDWNVAFWKLTRTVEHVRERYYVKNEYTPVISYGYEHFMEMMPRPDVMLKGSVVSPTLLSSIIYKKYGLGLPIERQVKEMNVNDLYFLPQTIERWIIRFADEYLWPVYDIFNGIIVNSSYIQSDETFLQVNGIGHKKCYVWVYITSELVKDGHKVIVFSYGPGRSEDHLIETLRGFSGVITSDAYAAYFAYEKDSAGDVTSSLCFMHMRRKWIEALIVLDLKNMSDETIKELPAFKAAKLIAKIYIEENKLRDLPADERLKHGVYGRYASMVRQISFI